MKKKNNKTKRDAPAPKAPRTEQRKRPGATAAGEIAQEGIIRALAEEVERLIRWQARILAVRRLLKEHGVPGADSYEGTYSHNAGRCPVCYKTGHRILEWVVCVDHNARWPWPKNRFHESDDPSSNEKKTEYLETFREVVPFRGPSPLWCYRGGNSNDHFDSLAWQIRRGLIEAVLDNPPPEEMIVEELETLKYLAIRSEEALRIDGATAEVDSHYCQGVDPYGVERDLPPECDCVGREYFARRRGSDIWVHFGDLPKDDREALQERMDKGDPTVWVPTPEPFEFEGVPF